MNNKSIVEDPRNHSKLKRYKTGSRKKEDLSGIITMEKQKPRTFTLRLPEHEHKNMQDLVEEVNKHSQYRKVSANDLVRALLHSAKKTSPEKLYKAINDLEY